MTIDEAIYHCQGRAKADCSECAEEYEQLVEWLKELKLLRERSTPMKVTDIHVDEYYCPACGAENNCDQGTIEDKFCPQCVQALIN